MSNESGRYRLWEHEVLPPKPPQRIVIAKVSGDVTATDRVAASASASR